MLRSAFKMDHTNFILLDMYNIPFDTQNANDVSCIERSPVIDGGLISKITIKEPAQVSL